MFEPDDIARWEFEPHIATVNCSPMSQQPGENKSFGYHPRTALVLIELELAKPAFWVARFSIVHRSNPDYGDPLGQRHTYEIVCANFTRHAASTASYIVESENQKQVKTPREVIELLEAILTRVSVESGR